MDDSLGSKSNVRMHMAYRGEHVTQFWPRHEKSIKRFSRLPWWLSGEEFTCQCRRHEFDLLVRKIPWKRAWQTTSVEYRKIPWTKKTGELHSMG